VTFPDLQSYVAELERTGQLRRVTVEVDPRLEVSEIVQRVVREEGPALLFDRVRGAAFPLVMNLFGSRRRIELASAGTPRRSVKS